MAETSPDRAAVEVATLGAGCFWCIESVFQQVRGVKTVESGYSGGTAADPSYKLVCTGTTGHAEVVQVTFDPTVISFREVLEVFFAIHNPTTLNRQGPDVGTQYRSAIFYHSPQQRETAEAVIHELTQQKRWPGPVVTELAPFTQFWKAEDYHQSYYGKHYGPDYCPVPRQPLARFLRVDTTV